jgi:cytochrome c oxidase cbb3-type subunit 3
MGGPNLLRSALALNDVKGELLAPIIMSGRGSMPPIGLPVDDVTAVAAYIHSVQAAGRAQGAPPPGETVSLNILVGDAAAGQAYFAAHCATCHSPTGDLRGIASRVTDPLELQNLWVGGGRDPAGRSMADPPGPRDAVATVAPASEAPVTGRLHRLDDFIVTVVLADGTQRTFRRVGDVPKVEVMDPLATHRAMLQQYTDRDVHDVTAYLATLR